MVLSSRRRTRAAWLLLAVLVLAGAVDAVRLQRVQGMNAAIAEGRAQGAAAGAPPQWAFAQAHALARSGDEPAALNAYAPLQGDSPLGQAARYNSANILLRQALAMRDAGAQPGQVLALIELAKEGYREVLRHDPGHWPARYNLERAQRLQPEPEDDDVQAQPAPHASERAPTTMRGFSLGLP